MPSLSGKSLSFGWLNCAVLLLLVLSGPLLVGCLQKWLVTSESFHGHKGNNHRSLRRILCLGDEFLDVESETCQKCPVCPYGYKLNKFVSYENFSFLFFLLVKWPVLREPLLSVL
ncbi:hypothetical protein HOLleu_30562 [Holothuria leucospilota]|uniref:Uncharacterized protein n=1 Tax=Holothuria leucospilota TaxID=206669 RepID=A0A9Q1BKV3_HOLLE|nr:hypothetical protein HOLleu_30562 [Holothuria leucospilota]